MHKHTLNMYKSPKQLILYYPFPKSEHLLLLRQKKHFFQRKKNPHLLGRLICDTRKKILQFKSTTLFKEIHLIYFLGGAKIYIRKTNSFKPELIIILEYTSNLTRCPKLIFFIRQMGLSHF